MFNFCNRPQPVFKMIIDGFHLYKATLTKVALWQILWILPFSLLAIAVHLMPDKPPAAGTPELIYPATINMGFMIADIFAFIISVFGQCFVLNRMHSIGLHTDASVQASLMVARDKLWRVMGGHLAIISLFVCLFLLARLGWSEIGLLTVVTLSILFLIFISTLWLFFPMLILFDGFKVLAALKESCYLVWGHWWRTFAVMLILTVILFVASAIIRFVVHLPGASLFTDELTRLMLAALLPAFGSAVLLVQFHDLKTRQAIANIRTR